MNPTPTTPPDGHSDEADALLRRIAEFEARLNAQAANQALERQQQETTDVRSENLLRMAAETARIITWDWNLDRGEFLWGTNPEGLLGPKPDSGEYPVFLDMVHPADLPDLMAAARAALASGDGFVEQLRLVRTDGEQRWILLRGQVTPRASSDGKALIGIAIDNHERRRAEYQSEQLSRQYRALLDNLPDFAWTKDLEGRYTAVNRAFAANVGMEPGELIGKLDADVLPAQTLAAVREQERRVIETRQTLRWEQPYFFREQQGWAEIVKSPVLDRVGNVIGVVGTSHDMTQRKEAEIELATSEKRFRDFAELSADWYWKQDAELRMVDLTENGAAPAPWTISYGKRRWEIPGIDLAASNWSAHKADLEARRPFRDFVFAVHDPVRGRVWARVSGLPIFSPAGEFLGYHGVGRDITDQMNSAEELRLAQERVALALQGSQLCFWDYDIVSGSVYLSEGWGRFCGADDGPTHTNINNLFATLHPDDMPVVTRVLRETLTGARDQYEIEHRSRINTGEYRWLYSRGKVTARDANGRALRMSGTNLDIHERHTLQENLRATLSEQEKLMEACPTGLAILRNRVFERCNAAVGRLLGYTPAELEGQSTRILFSDDKTWSELGEFLYQRESRSDGPYSIEVPLRRRDGEIAWTLLSGFILDPSQNYGIFSLVDVTAQRSVSSALLAAKEAADSANKAKSDFLATVSHEIRTPMNGVLGLLELLELSKLDDAQRDTVRTVRELAGSLLGLIDDVLDFSKIEAGQLPLRPEAVNLPALARQSVSLYQELASRKNLTLSLAIDDSIADAHVCDGMRIRQILNNLLSNAVKFTIEGGIEVRLKSLSREDGMETLSLHVVDTGIGISTEDQSRLFQPFVQADAGTTRKFGGTGLGLSICKRLAKALGGDISMSSALGRGTDVVMTLRLPTAPAESAVPLSAPNQPIENSRDATTFQSGAMLPPVLVAEDHAVNLRLLVRQLQHLGLKTETASDGMEALNKWSQGRYLAVITDCHMPVMDGYELAREIRSVEKQRGVERGVPIIAYTASALAGDAQACRDAGMNDHIAKPVSIAALRRILAPWISANSSASQELMDATTSLPPIASPIDPAALIDFSGGNPEAECEILEEFLNANRADANELLRAVQGGDLEATRHFAHRIKGACRAVGAAPLAGVCENIELRCREGDFSSARSLIGRFENEDRRLLDYIETRVTAIKAGMPIPVDRASTVTQIGA